jgi:hypothetical protein
MNVKIVTESESESVKPRGRQVELEVEYVRNRIALLVGQLDAIDKELVGSSVVDVKDRSDPRWSFGLVSARRVLDERDSIKLKLDEMQREIEWWMGKAGSPSPTPVVSDRDRDISVRSDWMQTYSGGVFWPLDPRPQDIVLADIAHALSNVCRFSGHVRSFYSVAQHSVLASFEVPAQDAKWALLHDAAEAYLTDLVRPIKHSPGGAWFRRIEANIMRCVCERFGLPLQQPESVDKADLIMLGTERRDLMAPAPRPWMWVGEPRQEVINPWGPLKAEHTFLARATQLEIW